MLNKGFDIFLNQDEMPVKWYNFTQDLPEQLPPTLDYESDVCSSQKETMQKIRPKALQEQEESKSTWIDIPDKVLEDLYRIGRPTPLRRAVNLEKYLDTPARIYYKREDTLLTGSFKISTAIPQAYYCMKEGFEGVISETGAGQWGMALSLASKLYGLDCKIFMSRCSLNQKPYRKYYMQLFNAQVQPSPSETTNIGRKLLASDRDHPGSIGTAISDGIETALKLDNYAYLSGSNMVHVLIHQTLLGLEVKKQMQKCGEKPDELIACVSGGSNLGGFMLPFLKEKLENQDIKFVGIESTVAPRLTCGNYDYDISDFAGFTPKVKSYTMGQGFIPAPIHVGGLRQHNGSPLIGLLRHLGILDAEAYNEREAFEAAKVFLHTEGLLVAPESSHAVIYAINSALRAKKEGKAKTIVILCSGNGFLDMEGYKEILL